jgi:hypothetical protein
LPSGVVVFLGTDVDMEEPGNNDSGKVARWAEPACVGKYSGPCCPQAIKATVQLQWTTARTKICGNNCMVKL